MFRIVARLKWRALAMLRKSPLTNVTPALSMATSVPLPIAIPTCACASAGASLIPSPTIPPIRPCDCRPFTPYASAADRLEIFRRYQRQVLLFGARGDRRCQWMLTAAFKTRSETQDLSLAEAGKRGNRHQSRSAFGERAGLVDNQRVHLLQNL